MLLLSNYYYYLIIIFSRKQQYHLCDTVLRICIFSAVLVCFHKTATHQRSHHNHLCYKIACTKYCCLTELNNQK